MASIPGPTASEIRHLQALSEELNQLRVRVAFTEDALLEQLQRANELAARLRAIDRYATPETMETVHRRRIERRRKLRS